MSITKESELTGMQKQVRLLHIPKRTESLCPCRGEYTCWWQTQQPCRNYKLFI